MSAERQLARPGGTWELKDLSMKTGILQYTVTFTSSNGTTTTLPANSLVDILSEEQTGSITWLTIRAGKETTQVQSFQVAETFPTQTEQIPDLFNCYAVDNFPCWALDYLINGDLDNLSDDEKTQVDRWVTEHPGIYSPCHDEDYSFFSHPAFGLATDCCSIGVCPFRVLESPRAAALSWLADLTFADVDQEDQEAHLATLTDLQLAKAVDRHWSGGWAHFLTTL